MYDVMIEDDYGNKKYFSVYNIDLKYVMDDNCTVLYLEISKEANGSDCSVLYRLWADPEGGRETDLDSIKEFISKQLEGHKLQLIEYLARNYLFIKDNQSDDVRQFSGRKLSGL